MPGHIEDRARQVVPRWRSFEASVTRGELLPLAVKEATLTDATLASNINDWRSRRSLSVAADLVCVALTLGRYEVARDAAEFLLARSVTDPLAGVATTYLARGDRVVIAGEPEVSKPALQVEIAEYRSRLREYPRNPILWTHLGRAYTSLGLIDRADRAIRAALSLAANNRFVVRCASRFFLHIGDPERAHHIVRRCLGVRSDPWLLAAELALADANGRTSRLIRDARHLLASKRYASNHLSELASALGTIEVMGGNKRAGQKLVRLSLEFATENATAQAAWLRRNYSDLNTPVVPVSSSWEAKAWAAGVQGNWDVVVKESERWQADEPFSSRPALIGSHAAIMAEAFDHAIEILKFGLMGNPTDFGLRNNLAYASAENGDIETAIQALLPVRKDVLTPNQQFVLDATIGLIAFRSGDAVRGRQLYERAIVEAQRLRDPNEVLARAHYAYELIRFGDSTGPPMRDEILAGVSSGMKPAALALMARLRSARVHRRTP